jgi:hypothetical protein
LKKGDTVWEIPESAFLYSVKDTECFVSKEIFDGWFSFDRRRAILKANYLGGIEVLTANIFPTEKQAQKAIASKLVKAIKKYANSLERELKQLNKQHKRWQILAND